MRGLSRSLLAFPILVLLLAQPNGAAPAGAKPTHAPILQRFLALDDPTPTQCRALRHLEAHNDRFDMRAWMDVWTEIDESGFHYRIVAEEGSDYIRGRVFREALEEERKMWASDAPDRASLTPANYTFEDHGAWADGLARLLVKPRRKDILLIDGAIFLRPDDGELLRMEGELSKQPSFWTRHVRIDRRFQRFAGIRMPIVLDASANIVFFGPSSFHVTYEYETVNSERVGTPQLRAASRDPVGQP
jgi:hypothetical protein